MNSSTKCNCTSINVIQLFLCLELNHHVHKIKVVPNNPCADVAKASTSKFRTHLPTGSASCIMSYIHTVLNMAQDEKVTRKCIHTNILLKQIQMRISKNQNISPSHIFTIQRNQHYTFYN